MEEIWKDIEGYEGLYQISSLGRVRSFTKKNNGKILKFTKTNSGYYQICLHKNKELKNFYIHRLVAIHFIPNPDNKLCVDHIDTNKLNNCVSNLKWVTHKENNNNKLTKEHMKENHWDCKKENHPLWGKQLSEEHRRKISENHADFKGKNHPFYGKNHTETTKEKISKKNKGRIMSSEQKEKISKKVSGINNGMYGKNHTEEAKRKISEANKGRNAKKVYCVELNKIFDSAKKCAEELGLYATSITKVCKEKQKTCGGYHFKYYIEKE